jgi:hypothetical protein
VVGVGVGEGVKWEGKWAVTGDMMTIIIIIIIIMHRRIAQL